MGKWLSRTVLPVLKASLRPTGCGSLERSFRDIIRTELEALPNQLGVNRDITAAPKPQSPHLLLT